MHHKVKRGGQAHGKNVHDPIADTDLAVRHETLMPLIRAPVNSTDQNRTPEKPGIGLPGERQKKRVDEQSAKDAIFYTMQKPVGKYFLDIFR